MDINVLVYGGIGTSIVFLALIGMFYNIAETLQNHYKD